jgi:hypothetical protein
MSPQFAQAGRQLEEPLADSVRGALSAAIASSAPPIPEFNNTESSRRKKPISKPAKNSCKPSGTKPKEQGWISP